MCFLLIFGLAACFFLPVSGGYDEEQHLIRVWEMSDYTFLPNEKLGNKLPFPRVYWEMSYRREFIVRAVSPDFREQYGDLSLDSLDYIYDIDTRSVYSPPLLLPQAITMRLLGRSLQWPALSVYYACRIAGLLSYAFLCLLAIRLVPYGRWTLAILVTSPVAILQAATITPDTISNGISFLFIAGCLAVAARAELGWKQLASLLLLILVLFWGKVNMVPLVLLPFLLIRPSQFKVRHGYFILLGAALLLFLVEVVGWNMLAYSRYHDALPGADPIRQVQFILADPFRFMLVLWNNLVTNFSSYLRAWIAIYGLDYWPVPTWTYYLYAAALLTTLFIRDENQPQKQTRIGLLLVFAATYLWTIVSLYLTYTPAGSELVLGVQGRYFAAVMPLLFLAIPGLPALNKFHVPPYVPMALGAISLALYVTGMYLSYHVVCGSQYYVPGLCYQPNYKNWAPDDLYSQPLSEELSLTQEVVAECKGVTEFRVWMDASNADPHGITEFTLVDTAEDRAVITKTISNDQLPDKGWYTLSFEPQMESQGKLYLFELHATGEPGPRFSYSLQPEYIEGKLYENGEAIGNDLIFQTGCVVDK